MASVNFGSKGADKPHLVDGKGGVAGEVSDLRSDVEEGFSSLESSVDSRVAVPVRLATAAPLGACTAVGTGVGKTLTQNAAAVEDIDGQAVVVGDRILVKNQVAGKDNGIYTVTTVGTVAVKQVLTRATDADESADFKTGKMVYVRAGTANANTTWMLATADPITLDTTAMTFASGGAAPAGHKASHENGGADEISVLGLSGLLADDQNPVDHAADHLPSGGDALAKSGTATAAAPGDVAVAFGVAYADANYKIALGNIGASDAVVKVGTKALGGFTLTFAAAGDCDWITIHD